MVADAVVCFEFKLRYRVRCVDERCVDEESALSLIGFATRACPVAAPMRRKVCTSHYLSGRNPATVYAITFPVVTSHLRPCIFVTHCPQPFTLHCIVTTCMRASHRVIIATTTTLLIVLPLLLRVLCAACCPSRQSMLRLGREKVLQWLRDCMAALPDVALTAADRDAFMAAAAAVLEGNAGMDGGCEALEDALEGVSDLCRRNRRASRAAQMSLLPAQLHAALRLV